MRLLFTTFFLVLLFAAGTLAQSIHPTIAPPSLFSQEQNAASVGPKTPPTAGAGAVPLFYFDVNLPRTSFQYPRALGSNVMLYMMQRFTLPNDLAFLDSIAVWIDGVSSGKVRFRVLPDMLVNAGSSNIRIPDFSISYDQIEIDKSALTMNAFNVIKMSGALVPKNFFVTVEYTLDGGTNNVLAVGSDTRTSGQISEQNTRTLMLIDNGTDIQVAPLISYFTFSGAPMDPYLYLAAFVDTATSSTTPVISTTPPTNAYTGQPYKYGFHASGIPRPYYILVSNPPAMTISNLSGDISWTPTVNDIGDHQITARAINANGEQDQTYNLKVVQSTAPKITSTPNKLAIVNELYAYYPQATGGPPPIWTIAAGPVGMSVVIATGAVSWIPKATQVGSFNVSIVAINGVASDTQKYVIKVDAAPVTPKITSPPVTAAQVNAPYAYQVVATGNPIPMFSLTKSPAGMQINPNSGLIQWAPDTSQISTFEVIVHAENRAGSNEQTFNLIVSAQPVLPVITSAPVTDAVAEKVYSYAVTANGTPAPVFTLQKSPTGMQINAASGAITWTPTRTQKGGNAVTVRATNSAGMNEQSFSINVTTVPKITSTPVTNAEETKLYQYQVTADAFPDAAYALTQSPAGMTINAASGAISWTPLPSQVGTQQVTVTATNSAGADQQQFSITVKQTVGVEEKAAAQEFYLGQNYPNPFSGYTTVDIRFAAADERNGSCIVYDLFGRKIADLSKDIVGRSSVVIRPFQLSGPGIYYYRLSIGNRSQTRMMTLLK